MQGGRQSAGAPRRRTALLGSAPAAREASHRLLGAFAVHLNRHEIEDAYRDLKSSANVYFDAAEVLYAYLLLVDANSDGWPYWHSGTTPAADLENIVSEGIHLLRPWGAYRDTTPTATLDDLSHAISRVVRFVKKRSNTFAPDAIDTQAFLALARKVILDALEREHPVAKALSLFDAA